MIRDDPAARRILFDTHWSSTGWRRQRTTPAADRAYAESAGYMFPAVPAKSAGHDRWVAKARAAAETTALSAAAAGFVGSLARRALPQRSALGSLASVRHLPAHAWRPWEAVCADCGVPQRRDVDLNVLSFERHKWGGVRHTDPVSASFDLDVFGRSERLEPTEADAAILRAVLDAARQSAASERPRGLEKRLAAIVPSNRAEREVLLQILGYCDVLTPIDHPGLCSRWTPYDRRDPPLGGRIDWTWPFAWWRGNAGVNEDVARSLFGEWLT